MVVMFVLPIRKIIFVLSKYVLPSLGFLLALIKSMSPLCKNLGIVTNNKDHLANVFPTSNVIRII